MDALGYRKKIGIVVPSTNTIVGPECEDLRPLGVTNHVARAGRSADRAPSSSPNQNRPTTIPLKRKWRRRQQPQRRLGPVGLLGAARSHSSLEIGTSIRARA